MYCAFLNHLMLLSVEDDNNERVREKNRSNSHLVAVCCLFVCLFACSWLIVPGLHRVDPSLGWDTHSQSLSFHSHPEFTPFSDENKRLSQGRRPLLTLFSFLPVLHSVCLHHRPSRLVFLLSFNLAQKRVNASVVQPTTTFIAQCGPCPIFPFVFFSFLCVCLHAHVDMVGVCVCVCVCVCVFVCMW